MKNLFASAFILFVFIGSIAAQPGGPPSFNAFDSCYYHPSHDSIFYARVISVSRIPHPLRIKIDRRDFKPPGNRTVYFKVIVEVEKVFKGDPKKLMEVFVNGEGRYYPATEKRYIFMVNTFSMDKSKSFFAESWSFAINALSKKQLDTIFSQIRFKLKRYPKLLPFIGTVVKRKTIDIEEYTGRGGVEELELGYNSAVFEPVVGITVVAKREKDGKRFRTTTNKQGRYVFDNLIDSDYDIFPIFPLGYEKTISKFSASKYCSRRHLFEMKTLQNQDNTAQEKGLPIKDSPDIKTVATRPLCFHHYYRSQAVMNLSRCLRK